MKKIVLLLILTTIFLSPNALIDVNSDTVLPVIDIIFLTPNTTTERIQWAELIKQEIAKIGINVTHNEIGYWDVIGPRT